MTNHNRVHDSKPVTVGDLNRAISDRESFRKNGHSWGEYLSKWVTPQNVVIVALAVFSVGGRVQEVQSGVSAALSASNVATAAIKAQEQLSRELFERSRRVDEQLNEIKLRQENYATKKDIEDLTILVKLSVTRREFRESVDAQQNIIRRLDRIEKAGAP